MELFLSVYKVTIIIMFIMIMLNLIRIIYYAFKSNANRVAVNIEQIKKAKSLFYAGIFSILLTVFVLFLIEEKIGVMNLFATMVLYIMGIIALLIAIISSALAFTASLNKMHGKANVEIVSEFNELFNVSFGFTVLTWLLSWFMS